jgi:flavodoxin
MLIRSLVLYSSVTGNTAKVAKRIAEVLRREGHDVALVKVDEKTSVDLLAYDLVFLGSAVHQWLPTKTMVNYVKRMLKLYFSSSVIVPSSPIRPSKYAVCFCTYSGPHAGVSEAIPATKWMRAFFEHVGFTVLEEWHTIGEFKNNEENSTIGRLGNIKGRPDEHDLAEIENRVIGILNALKLMQE